MKKTLCFTLLIWFSFFVAGCSESTTPEDKPEPIPTIQFIEFEQYLYYRDSLDLDYSFEEDARINGDTLKVTVSYLGGCEEHDFSLLCSEVFQMTNPATATTIIIHETDDDTCQQTINEQLFFDVSPLRQIFRKYGVVYISLLGNGRLRYEF